MGEKKRPVVGVMTGSFHSDYPRTIFFEMYRLLAGDDLDIRLYNGLDGNIYFNRHHNNEDGFDTHWLSLYEYSKFDDLDLLIVAYGNIMASHPHIEAEEFLSNLPDVPVIIIGSDIEPDNGAYIMIDNYAGMKANVAHLIEHHGYKDIGFVSGPKENQSASLRMEAYLDALEEHGLPIRDELIVYGDYSNNSDVTIEELFERGVHLDAIVSSNDEMCNAIYRVAENHGLKVGKDLAVTGFDDADFAAHLDPPLTTIRQDYRLLVKELVDMIHDFFDGRGLCSRHVPASCITRQSCGCGEIASVVSHEGEPEKKEYISYDKVYQMQQQNMATMVLLRQLLIEVQDRRTFFEKLAEEMSLENAKSSYIYLLDEPMLVTKEQPFVLAEDMQLYMRQEGAHIEGFEKGEGPRIGHGEFYRLQRESAERPTMMVSFLLFFGRYQYGILRVEADPKDILFFYSLSIQIANGLRHLSLILRQEQMNHMLSEQNKMLDYAAYHDTLTGLYNRAGVMTQMLPYMAENESARYVAVMGDLDHLKQINDTFGHEAGDTAIKAVARILSDVLPEGCLLGRTGGDEFTGLFRLRDDKQPMELKEAVKQRCRAYDKDEGQPFYLGISIGMQVFSYETDTAIAEEIKRADEALYEAKKHRRDNVIR